MVDMFSVRWHPMRFLAHISKLRDTMFELFTKLFSKITLTITSSLANWRGMRKASEGFFLFRACLTIIGFILLESTSIQEILRDLRLQCIIKSPIVNEFRLEWINTSKFFKAGNLNIISEIINWGRTLNCKSVNSCLSMVNTEWQNTLVKKIRCSLATRIDDSVGAFFEFL